MSKGLKRDPDGSYRVDTFFYLPAISKENSPMVCNKDRKIFDKELSYSLKNVIAKLQDFFIDEAPDAPKWAEAIA